MSSAMVIAAGIGVAGNAIISSRNKGPNIQEAAQTGGEQNIQFSREQARMNNPNINMPGYSTSYTESTDPGGRPTVTTTLSPAEQAAQDQRNRLRAGFGGALEGAIPGMSETLKGKFGVSTNPMLGFDPRYAPTAGDIQKDAGLAQAGPLQTGLDFGGAPAMPVASDATRQAVTNAVYQQGARFLDPQFAQQQGLLTGTEANQGITQGTEAARQMQDAYDRSKTLAYGDLGDRATQAGMQAMQQLYAMQMAARQQGVGEISSQGQFANASQAQAAQELLASMNARNSAATTGANIANLSSTAFNNAQGMTYDQYLKNTMLPFNLAASLQGATQVTSPTFQPIVPTSMTPSTALAGAIGQGQMNAANASSQSAIFGGALNAGANYYGNKGSTAPSLFSQPAAPISDFSTPAAGYGSTPSWQ